MSLPPAKDRISSAMHNNSAEPAGTLNALAQPFHCALNDYVMREFPGSQWKPTDEHLLTEELRALGATDDTLGGILDALNRQWERVFSAAPGGTLLKLGFKPEPDDPDVTYLLIPGSHLVLRVWDGGLEQLGRYCFDIFDIDARVSVNTPRNWALLTSDYPGGQQWSRLKSWEEECGMKDVPEGMERYSALEGAHILLDGPWVGPCILDFPRRPYSDIYGSVEVQPTSMILWP